MNQNKKAYLFILLISFAGFFYGSTARAQTAGILINEVAWMGTAESANNEWLELKNTGEAEVDLAGWILRATDGSPVINLAGKISAGGYFLLERTDDNTLPAVMADQIYVGSLSNSGEILELLDASGAVVDRIDGSGGPPAGEAGWPAGDNATKATMERKADGTWQTSAAPGGTPKAANSAGLVIEEEVATTTASSTNTNQASAGTSVDASEATVKKQVAEEPIINELLPNPAGPDDLTEFIELYNPNDNEINLSDWRLETKLGNFQFKDRASSSVARKGYLTLWRSVSRLPLANLDDTLKLYSATGKLIDQVKYKKAEAGKSYCLDERGKWQWCSRPTPGTKNYYNAPPRLEVVFPKEARAGAPVVFDSSDIFDPEGRPLTFSWDFGDGATNDLMTAEHTFLQPGNYVVRLTAGDQENEVREEATIKVLGPNGEKISTAAIGKTKKAAGTGKVAGVKIAASNKKTPSARKGFARLTGTVLVPPGVLGSQIFYLGGERPAQIYSYKKDFPRISIGDRVEVAGEWGEQSGLPRLKTKSAGDIRVLGRESEPAAEKIACSELDETRLGRLVKVAGEVTKRSGSTIYLDDSSEEAVVYIKAATGIDAKSIRAGEKAEVTGVVEKTASGLRVLPRRLADIVRPDAADAATYGEPTAGDWSVPPRDQQSELLKYLLVIAGGVILVLAGMLVKYRQKIKM